MECGSLKQITVDSANPAYCSVDGVLFTKDKKTLVQVPGALTSYAVPEGTEKSKLFSIAGENLTKIEFPASMKDIDDADYSFEYCPKLQSIQVAGDSRSYSAADGVLFSKDGSVLYSHPPAKEISAEYTVPSDVREIGDYAFRRKAIRILHVPEGVETIDWEAFGYNKTLETVYLPASLKKIDYAAFNSCDALKDVWYAGSKSDWKKADIDSDAFPKGVTFHYNSK